MKRFIPLLAILAIFCLTATATAATVYNHIFFICEKKTANIGGVDYDYYEVTSGGETYYLMEYGWPHPPGYTIFRVTLLANSGSNYLLHFYTTQTSKALIAAASDQYAGGGSSRNNRVALASAHLTYAFASINQKGPHSAFPAQAAIKLTIPCRWKESGDWVSGTYGDWLTAGGPWDTFTCNPVMDVFE